MNIKTITLADAQALTGCDFYDYLDAQSEVPTVTTVAAQGDVLIYRVTTKATRTPLPTTGFVVAQSGQGGHAHTLTGAGYFDPAPVRDGSLKVGTLTVPEGVDVLLSHPEHGALLIAPGTYTIGTQREYAGEWRAVTD